MNAQLDHVVVLAPTLLDGVAWCERTLGVVPGPGGQHALMGTHNRLFAIGGSEWPMAYFEIIAIDPLAPAPKRQRWFGMDDEAVRARLQAHGPFLAHWVVRVDDVTLAAARWAWMGLDVGPALAASRQTPDGPLSWRITVRPDGQPQMHGCLPTLIQWQGRHPAERMPASGVVLRGVSLRHPQARALFAALEAIGMAGVQVSEGEPQLALALDTPRGPLALESAP